MCDLEQNVNAWFFVGCGSKSMLCQSSLAWMLIATVLSSVNLLVVSLLVQSSGCVSKGS